MTISVENDRSVRGGYAILVTDREGERLSVSIEDILQGQFLGADGRWGRTAAYFEATAVPGRLGAYRLGPEVVDLVPTESLVFLRLEDGTDLGQVAWSNISPRSGGGTGAGIVGRGITYGRGSKPVGGSGVGQQASKTLPPDHGPETKTTSIEIPLSGPSQTPSATHHHRRPWLLALLALFATSAAAIGLAHTYEPASLALCNHASFSRSVAGVIGIACGPTLDHVEETTIAELRSCVRRAIPCAHEACTISYTSRYPAGRHASEIREIATAATKACARLQDEEAYQSAVACTQATEPCQRGACIATYTSRYPEGRFKDEIGRLTQASTQQCASEREKALFEQAEACSRTASTCSVQACFDDYRRAHPLGRFESRIIPIVTAAEARCINDKEASLLEAADTCARSAVPCEIEACYGDYRRAVGFRVPSGVEARITQARQACETRREEEAFSTAEACVRDRGACQGSACFASYRQQFSSGRAEQAAAAAAETCTGDRERSLLEQAQECARKEVTASRPCEIEACFASYRQSVRPDSVAATAITAIAQAATACRGKRDNDAFALARACFEQRGACEAQACLSPYQRDFPEGRSRSLVDRILSRSAAECQGSLEERSFREAEQCVRTVNACGAAACFMNYQQSYSQGRFRADMQALLRVADQRCKDEAEDRILASANICADAADSCSRDSCFAGYLSQYSSGRHLDTVNARIRASRAECWESREQSVIQQMEQCVRSAGDGCNAGPCFSNFLSRFPASSRRGEVERLRTAAEAACRGRAEDTAWSAAVQCASQADACSSSRCFESFLGQHPSGNRQSEAEDRIQRSQQACSAEREESVFKQALTCAATANPCDVRQCFSPFTSTYPASRFIGTVNQRVASAANQCLAWPNGLYSGGRGYTSSTRPNPGTSCLDHYGFTAEVENGIITFESDNVSWRGRIDQRTGQVLVEGRDASPPTRNSFRITGSAGNATMTSGFCGNGSFRLDRQSYVAR